MGAPNLTYIQFVFLVQEKEIFISPKLQASSHTAEDTSLTKITDSSVSQKTLKSL